MDDKTLSAYCYLAEAISIEMHRMAVADAEFLHKGYPSIDEKTLIFHHYFTSTFEGISEQLLRLTIFERINGNSSLFTFSKSDYGSTAKENWTAGPSFAEILNTFIEYFGEYGTQRFGFDTDPDALFHPTGLLTRAIDALAELGYLEKIDTDYRWTEKIRPSMYASGYWPEHAEPD